MQKPELAPLKLTLYGTGDTIVREITRSIVPWGVLERALDLQELFADLDTDEQGNPTGITRDHVAELTNFVVFIFNDEVTPDELSRTASLGDMFALYRQVFAMVSGTMQKNPTPAPAAKAKADLQKVRNRGRR